MQVEVACLNKNLTKLCGVVSSLGETPRKGQAEQGGRDVLPTDPLSSSAKANISMLQGTLPRQGLKNNESLFITE